MIVTDLKYADNQVVLTEGIKEALDFLRNTDLQELSVGRLEIDGDRLFALVQSYESRMEHESPRFELHQRNIDVQYIISGEEIMAWAPHHLYTQTEPYNEENDLMIGAIPAGKWTPVLFPPGQVIIHYPTDAHASGLAVDQPIDVKKIILKVLLI